MRKKVTLQVDLSKKVTAIAAIVEHITHKSTYVPYKLRTKPYIYQVDHIE